MGSVLTQDGTETDIDLGNYRKIFKSRGWV